MQMRSEQKINWAFVWCTECEKIQPLVADYLPRGELNEHDGMDLVCAECKFILVTLHETQ